jgi:hypothetical protein
MKGSSFSFAVFGCYGFYWITFGVLYMQRSNLNSTFGEAEYSNGMTMYLAQWGGLSVCFWFVTWRKNIALICIFSLLSCTFFLLAIATGTGSKACKMAGGSFGFVTALGALYTGIAELINEEYGRMVLPGLTPLYSPQRVLLTKEAVRALINYDERSNTLWLQFRGLQIRSLDDIKAIREGIVSIIQEALDARVKHDQRPVSKVHVVADYDHTVIAEDISEDYWKMASALEREYYLSVTRFHISSFGTRNASSAVMYQAVAMDGEPRTATARSGSAMNTPSHSFFHTSSSVNAEDAPDLVKAS